MAKKTTTKKAKDQPAFTTLTLEVHERVATITLDRPQRLNAINAEMPREIRQAVEAADADERVHVIVLQGAGAAFCAGYDLKDYAEGDTTNAYTQPMPWDPMRDYALMNAVAGGSDIALCADIVIMAEDAKIGYMPARVWGCPTTAMWVYRVGAQRAKRMLFTGDLIDGRTAADWGLALQSVPAPRLDDTVHQLAKRIAGVPKNQLMMHKLTINQAVDAMGLEQTQMFATIFDGITRHSPEGLWFKRYAEEHGFQAATEWRDSGRPIPEPPPGDLGDAFMAAPARSDARSAWSSDVTGKRRSVAKKKPR